MELINVLHIFHDSSVKACLPTNIKFDDPFVVYSITIPIRFKIFNFDKFVFNLDDEVFIQDKTIFPCNFAGSSFIDNVSLRYKNHNWKNKKTTNYLLRVLNIEKPVSFHGKKLNIL